MKFEIPKWAENVLSGTKLFTNIKAAAEGEETPAMPTYEMKDGTMCSAEKMEAGMPITMVDGAALPDGEHELTDGTKFKVEGGVITEVMPAEGEGESPERKLEIEVENLKAEVINLKAAIAAKSKEVEAIKAEAAEAVQVVMKAGQEEIAKISKGIQMKADKEEVIANKEKDTLGMWRGSKKNADPIAEAAIAEWNTNPYEKKFGASK